MRRVVTVLIAAATLAACNAQAAGAPPAPVGSDEAVAVVAAMPVPTPSPTIRPAPTARWTPTPTPAPTPAPTPDLVTGALCEEQIGEFLDAINNVDAATTVGVKFADYYKLVTKARAAYQKLPVRMLGYECLHVGAAGERAFNNWANAYDAWDGCFDKFTTSKKYDRCFTKNVRPKWRTASGLTGLALETLAGLKYGR